MVTLEREAVFPNEHEDSALSRYHRVQHCASAIPFEVQGNSWTHLMPELPQGCLRIKFDVSKLKVGISFTLLPAKTFGEATGNAHFFTSVNYLNRDVSLSIFSSVRAIGLI